MENSKTTTTTTTTYQYPPQVQNQPFNQQQQQQHVGPPPAYGTNQLPNYSQNPGYVQQPASVVVVQQIGQGNCPSCRNGNLVDDYSCLGVFLAICCFPIGIICCLLMTEKRCPRCNARYG